MSVGRIAFGFLLLAALAAAPSLARADAASDEEARALYEAGRIAFEQGRFRSALARFQESHELSGRPELLYNIGTTADRLRLDELALESFREFLRLRPDSAEGPSVRARIEVLEEALASEAPAAPPPEDDAPSEPMTIPELEADPEAEERDAREDAPPLSVSDAERGVPVAGVALSAGGLAVVGAGVALLAVGQEKRRDAEGVEPGTPFADVRSLASRADAMTAAGVALSVVGVAGSAAGLVLVLKKSSEPDAPTASLELVPGGLRLGGSF